MRPVSCHWLGCGGGGVTEEGRVIPSPVIVTRGQGLGGGRSRARGLVRHISLSIPFSLSFSMRIYAFLLHLAEKGSR